MTEEQIITANELCIDVPTGCRECPYYPQKNCVKILTEDTIHLIRTQKARIKFEISSRQFAEATANKIKAASYLEKAAYEEMVAERNLLKIQLEESIAEIERLKEMVGESNGITEKNH